MNQAAESQGIRAVSSGRVETLMLEGELLEKDLARVCEELVRRMQRGLRNVVLDFSEVDHLDYRGVPALVARAEAFRKAGGDIKLAGLSPYLAAILRAAGAHDVFELYPHMNDARAAFAMARAPFV
ncbi:STAS domain-containing protein [Archangium lipolyticum]|uniref:STAS domain-containing protein n=1 Tax=Archangium lipolyticum TaxID=2970465 RepID=UPI00214A45D0|nr:STAS domain-containing protein [Archangium lipolyticum]